jgi:hypothetical protein
MYKKNHITWVNSELHLQNHNKMCHNCLNKEVYGEEIVVSYDRLLLANVRHL